MADHPGGAPPALITAGDLGAAERARAELRLLPAAGLSCAVVTDGRLRAPAEQLREAGLSLTGLLGPDALESLAWAAEAGLPAAYSELASLLTDAGTSAVAVDLRGPQAGQVARAALQAGLHVLLCDVVVGDAALVRELLDLAEDAGLCHAVALDALAQPWVQALAAALPDLGAVRQLVVTGWPARTTARAELVDLALRWGGDVVAVCADPDQMPAPQLTPNDPVTLALLHHTGATTLVGERTATTPTITVSGTAGQLCARPGHLAWSLPTGRGGVDTPPSGAPRAGVRAAATGLVRTRGSDPGAVRPPGGAGQCGDLFSTLACTRVLAALEDSRANGGWVELS